MPDALSCLTLPQSGPRLRADLVHRQLQLGDRKIWVVKDPISSNFYYFTPREHSILKSLDGRDAKGLLSHYAKNFASDYLSADTLISFLSQIQKAGLLVTRGCDATATEISQASSVAELPARKLRAGLMSPLAVRLPGLNPSGLLRFLSPITAALWRPMVFVGALAVMLLAAVVLIVRADQFLLELVASQNWLSPDVAITLAIVISITKVAHELGHAVACERLGGKCREIGLMFLVFVPCLYCDVSDAWLQSSRWKRIAISAAGMMVELFIAALAVLLWAITIPGTLHSICITVVVVCSVSTLLFNGNPLMRYDGYYILSDLIRIPNLAAESSNRLAQKLKALITGLNTKSGRVSGGTSDWMLVVYAILSTLYRAVIIAAILFAIHKFASQWDLRILAWLLSIPIVFSMMLRISRVLKAGRVSAIERRSIRRGRIATGLCVALAIVGGVLLIPMRQNLAVPFLIEAADQQQIYAKVSGRVEEGLAYGTAVKVGDTIARLANREVEFEYSSLTLKKANLQQRLSSLQELRSTDASVAEALPVLKQEIKATDEQLRLLQRQRNEQLIKSDSDGTLIAPRAIRTANFDDSKQLSQWRGTPLDPRNRGAFMQRGTLVGLIVSESRRAVLFVAQQSIESLRTGQAVQLAYPGFELSGSIEAIDAKPIETLPPEIVATQSIAVNPYSSGDTEPAESTFRVTVKLDRDSTDETLTQGRRLIPARTSGMACVQAAPRSLLSRAIRFLSDSIRFEL